jgi:hypothetical protein
MLSPALIAFAVATIQPTAPLAPQTGVNPPGKGRVAASSPRVKELQKERIAALKALAEQLDQLFRNSRAEFKDVVEARVVLLNAEIDAAETGADRIPLYKKAIDNMREYEKLTGARVASGRGTTADVLRVTARRLEIEIRLERARGDEAGK